MYRYFSGKQNSFKNRLLTNTLAYLSAKLLAKKKIFITWTPDFYFQLHVDGVAVVAVAAAGVAGVAEPRGRL